MAKRRSNGEGSLRLRADGRWEMTISDGYRDDGKRKTKTFYGKTQKEVKNKAKAYQLDKEAGLVPDVRYRFSDWADQWFEHHKYNISETTQENYSYTLRILKSEFGRRWVSDIKAYDIEVFLQKLRRDGKSDSCLSHCRGMMFQIMERAEANDYIRKNPVRLAEKMRQKGPVQMKDAFTAEEVRALMNGLPDDRMGQSIRVMNGTGIRAQELLALEPKHIAPDGSAIRIEQAVAVVHGIVVIVQPKSRDSKRCVPVPESIRPYAVRLRSTDRKFVWEMGKKDSPCNPSAFRKHFKEALAAVPGVRILTPHCCRHTYVSQMQALGVDLATIRSLVGHADIDMTQHYLHVQESIRQDAIARFSEAFPAAAE